jgi:hypothetical protein
MTTNWKDIPDLIHFANEKDIYIHFNVVWNPGYLSLNYLHHSKLKEISAFYEMQEFESNNSIRRENLKNFNDLKKTIADWLVERNFTLVLQDRKVADFNSIYLINNRSELIEKEIFIGCLLHYLNTSNSNLINDIPEIFFKTFPFDNPSKIKQLLIRIWDENGNEKFLDSYYSILPLFYKFFFGEIDMAAFKEKVESFKSLIVYNKNIDILINDIIDDIQKYSIVSQLDFMKEKKLDEMIRLIEEIY